jgi:hypothetical protein
LGAWGSANARKHVDADHEIETDRQQSARPWIAVAGIVGVLL